MGAYFINMRLIHNPAGIYVCMHVSVCKYISCMDVSGLHLTPRFVFYLSICCNVVQFPYFDDLHIEI